MSYFIRQGVNLIPTAENGGIWSDIPNATFPQNQSNVPDLKKYPQQVVNLSQNNYPNGWQLLSAQNSTPPQTQSQEETPQQTEQPAPTENNIPQEIPQYNPPPQPPPIEKPTEPVQSATPTEKLVDISNSVPRNEGFSDNAQNYSYNRYIPQAGSIGQNFLNRTYNVPVPNPRDMNLIDAATDSKILYARSQEHINGLENSLKNPNLTDEQRTKISNAIEEERKFQSYIADRTAMMRNANPNFDFDAYGVGSGNTVQESVQARENLMARVTNSLYDANDAAWQQVQKVYDDARARGIPASVAEGMAQREKERLGRGLRQQREDIFANYGVTPDGRINQFGVQLLGSMARSDPDAAKMYSQLLTTPQQAYQLDNATMNNILTLSAAGDRQAQSILAQMAVEAARLANARYLGELSNATNLYQIDSSNYNQAERRKIDWSRIGLDEQKAIAETQRKLWEEYNKSPEGKVAGLVRAAYSLYGENADPETVLRFVEKAGFNGGGSNEKLDSARRAFNVELSSIKDGLKKGDKQKTLEAIQALRGKLTDENSIYYGVIGMSEYQPWGLALDYLERGANGEIPATTLDKLLYDLEHAGTPKENHFESWYADMKRDPAGQANFRAMVEAEIKKHKSSGETGGFLNNIIENYGKVPPSAVGDPNAYKIYEPKYIYNTGNGTGYYSYGQ